VGAGEWVPPVVVVAEPGAFEPANTATPLQPASSCNIERIDQQAYSDAPITVAAGKGFTVAGYVYDAEHERVPAELRLRAIAADGSAFEARLHARIDRPDVPQYFGIGEWARRSGFEAALPPAALAPGEYRLVLTFANGAKLYACDVGRKLRIGG
jgi:hypothetical protein